MDHHETAAADITAARMHDCFGITDRDRGIDGVTAAPEDIDADLAGDALFGYDHAVPGRDRLRSGLGHGQNDGEDENRDESDDHIMSLSKSRAEARRLEFGANGVKQVGAQQGIE
jgi:hypothetical protein